MILIKTVVSFVLSRKIINIYNDIAQKYGNVTVKDFRTHEKLEYKKNKLKLNFDFLNDCINLVCIRNSLSLHCRMFPNKDALSIRKRLLRSAINSVIKNYNIFQNNSVYPKTFYLHSFLLLTFTYLQNYNTVLQ